VDEALDHWHHVRVLCAYVHHQGAFQAEQIGGEDRSLVHEESIELVLLEKQFDQFLTILLAAERRLDVEERVL